MTRQSSKVGARPGSTLPPDGGGGYPDICNELSSADRPIQKILAENFELGLQDLEAMGLAPKWIEIAASIGPSKFIEIWAILDRENVNQPKAQRDRMRIWVPSFSTLMKFVRNRAINEAIDNGMETKEIYEMLRASNLEPIVYDALTVLVGKRRRHTEAEAEAETE